MQPIYLKRAGIALAALTAAVHVFIGSFDTLLPLVRSDLSPEVLGAFHACWHFVSLFLVVSVWHFFKDTPLVPQLAWLWVGFALCFVVAALVTAGLGGLIVLPQWSVLGLAGVLMLLGESKTKAVAPQ